MKHCPKCKVDKPFTDFYKRSGREGGYKSYCKKCDNAECVVRQRKLKTQCVELGGGCCQICGYNKYQGALEFHHLDPKGKDFHISQLSTTKLTDRIRNEIAKCILVCSNCHKEIHAGLVKLDIT